MSKDTELDLTAALDSLSPKERQIVDLLYAEELSASEIASLLGTDAGTIENIQRLVLHKMKKFIPEE